MLTEAKEIQIGPSKRALEWVDRGWYIVIEFDHSSSKRFEEAVTIARTSPNFTELVDEKSATIYRTIYFHKDYHEIKKLYEKIQNWKNVRVYVKGTLIPRDRFEYWYACQQFYWQNKPLERDSVCGIGKEKFPAFVGCFNRNIYLKWRDPFMNSYHYSSKMWYDFGKFDEKTNTYALNKSGMLAFLDKVNAKYQDCICYRQEWIEKIIEKLPDSICLEDHGEWIHKEDFVRINRSKFYNPFIIGYSDVPEICPKNQIQYQNFMKRIFN